MSDEAKKAEPPNEKKLFGLPLSKIAEIAIVAALGSM
jgi:hypothetical protein